MVESECIRRARSGASHMRLRRARLARRMKSDKLQFVAFRLSRGLCRHLLRQTSVCRLPPFTWTMPSPSTTNFSLSPSAFHVDYAVTFYDKLKFVVEGDGIVHVKGDRKSTLLNSSHYIITYTLF